MKTITLADYCAAWNEIESGHFIHVGAGGLEGFFQIRKGTNVASQGISPMMRLVDLLPWCEAMFPNLKHNYSQTQIGGQY